MGSEVQPLVVSASRRTDIPNYYAPWFLERLRQGYVLVRNVRDHRKVRKVDLSVEAVACIVFWTKNPAPLVEYLSHLDSHRYYMHYTITGYGSDIEPRIPPIGESIDRFRRIAEHIGPQRIIWRYDPIFFNATYPLEYHMEIFARIAAQLGGYTTRCVFSFLDRYRHLEATLDSLGIGPFRESDLHTLAQHISQHCKSNGMEVQSCAEPYDLSSYGITHGACIDAQLVEKLSGIALPEKRDRSQRPDCRCAPSIDIGMYNTCLNLCSYCYANHNTQLVHANYAKARSTSEFIVGAREHGDVIEEKIPVATQVQLSLFGAHDE